MSSRSKRRSRFKSSELASRQNSQSGQTSEKQLVAMQTEFRGPLPPPELLQRYEEIHPGTAERIIQQFERETQHRHAIEHKVVDAQIHNQQDEALMSRRGQMFAFFIGIVGLVSSALCIGTASIPAQAWAGGGIGGISLATLAGAFLYGRKAKPTKEVEEKKQP